MKSNDNSWSLLEPTGQLVNMKSKRNIPAVLKDIGLGASIYLLTLKAFAWLFIALSLLNIPVLWLYYKGVEASRLNTSILTSFMLGNVGESGPICNSFDISNKEHEVRLACPSGDLIRLVSLGLSSVKDQQCLSEEYNRDHTAWLSLDKELKVEEGFIQKEGAWYFQSYMEYFEECSTYQISKEFRTSKFVTDLLT